MATRMAHSWQDTLTTCGMPLTCGLEFRLQNRGVNAILLDGKELDITKKYKRVFADLVENHIWESLGPNACTFDAELPANLPHNKGNTVTINLNNGSPVYQRATFRLNEYSSRRDKAAYDNRTPDDLMGFDIEE